MRRLARPLSALALLAFSFAGCAKKSSPMMSPADSMGGAMAESMSSPGSAEAASMDDASAAPSAMPEMAAKSEVAEMDGDMIADAESEERLPVQARPVRIPELTAGTFDDTLNPATLHAFATSMLNLEGGQTIASALVGPLTVVRVVDGRGAPLADVGVTIEGQRNHAKTLRSGTDGRVVIMSAWDLRGETGDTFVITAGGEHAVVQIGSQETRLVVRDRTAQPVRSLDLALVIDATGSMGDEIEYLKAEIANIAHEVARTYPGVDQRYALVVYRDEGDQYVTRHFNFTHNLGRFTKQLGRQQADGGGDYPEAMDAAMLDAAALSWRDRGSRMLFLVADAPPHAEAMAATLNTAEELRGQGVAMYPIAASGVAESAELVMRAAAAMSGGEYIFLTDDSGVGNTHAEPHIPCYSVQTLRNSMLRAIASELAGERIEADPQRTIRQVGSSQGGVCTAGKPQLAS